MICVTHSDTGKAEGEQVDEQIVRNLIVTCGHGA